MDSDVIKEWIRDKGQVSFARSGGPGGQNVNKTETKVILHLPIVTLPFSEQKIARVYIHLANRINSDGQLVIHSSSTRSQGQNRERAELIAFRLITAALLHRKKRRLTRPTKASRERRIQSKKGRGKLKQERRDPIL